ncbi:hypothetical protein [Flavilitoribacter nigricans]|uniref:Uncharacterized protein n=1 Tax=Flavilitoribacter nigricans (strain ATCC 23147 / DSM 23189 / NBRC 102662 / NCIMB 1420 / SS-2) TaxID=1122177 RepID=A0A2D0NFB4_FLAN2|nr:hypothetical protein [Flavilitoribacter nigricans]PHN07167.1 hypothetical protein CRP01_08045 [Flavilitoribacter nigricans DSM 23189 = NBRC 102662]
MFSKSFYSTVNLSRLTTPAGFALRLLLPVLIIYMLPTEEDFFQNVFQGEGLLRIARAAWTFRFSFAAAIKKAGLSSLVFGVEEVLQEVCLYFLI